MTDKDDGAIRLAKALGYKPKPTREAELMGILVVVFLTLLVLLTIGGIWYRLFWLGWVMAGGG